MTQPLHEAGLKKLEAAELIPLLSHDLGIVVRRQLDHHPANADLIVWLLNNARELLNTYAAVAECIGELSQWSKARDVIDPVNLPLPHAYAHGHVEAREILACRLGWLRPTAPGPEAPNA
ncbi:hypothetical protein [Nocardia sp. CA-290969]|uniref:hypothetical protein n=1 Tax=Nocardia sp. CA-290969 TaxID=3239986 RepID=UPI003D92CC04